MKWSKSWFGFSVQKWIACSLFWIYLKPTSMLLQRLQYLFNLNCSSNWFKVRYSKIATTWQSPLPNLCVAHHYQNCLCLTPYISCCDTPQLYYKYTKWNLWAHSVCWSCLPFFSEIQFVLGLERFYHSNIQRMNYLRKKM